GSGSRLGPPRSLPSRGHKKKTQIWTRRRPDYTVSPGRSSPQTAASAELSGDGTEIASWGTGEFRAALATSTPNPPSNVMPGTGSPTGDLARRVEEPAPPTQETLVEGRR